jgi:predicted lactoylglutathione lyase
MIFINLPVQDLQAARDFYESLGFRFHDHFSDEHTAALAVDDTTAVLVHTAERFAELVPGEVGELPTAPTVVHSLVVDNREDVDDIMDRALAAAGRPGRPARSEDSRYTASFTDPDAHVWEIVWMEAVHVID